MVIVLLLGALLMQPVFGQFAQETHPGGSIEMRDRDAIRAIMREYEAAFNTRDIDRRMALCLESYHEYGFEYGGFLESRDYGDTFLEVGRYWQSIRRLDYSIDMIVITLDGPQAFVRAHTTHLAGNDRHNSIVHFSLVKIDGRWWIAWNSYNIVRRYE